MDLERKSLADEREAYKGTLSEETTETLFYDNDSAVFYFVLPKCDSSLFCHFFVKVLDK